MRRLLVLALPLLAVAACGGGGEEEKAVRTNVERFFASDLRGCALETERLLRNTQDVPDTSAAVASCRRREQQRQAGRQTDSPFAPTRGAEVSAIEVDGAKASAKAKLQGGDLDGQVLGIRLVRQSDVWKIDRIDGLRLDAAMRRRYDEAFTANVRTALRGKVPDDEIDSTISCITERFTASVPNERLADQYEGKLAPGTLSRAGEEAAKECLAAASESSSS